LKKNPAGSNMAGWGRGLNGREKLSGKEALRKTGSGRKGSDMKGKLSGR